MVTFVPFIIRKTQTHVNPNRGAEWEYAVHKGGETIMMRAYCPWMNFMLC